MDICGLNALRVRSILNFPISRALGVISIRKLTVHALRGFIKNINLRRVKITYSLPHSEGAAVSASIVFRVKTGDVGGTFYGLFLAEGEKTLACHLEDFFGYIRRALGLPQQRRRLARCDEDGSGKYFIFGEKSPPATRNCNGIYLIRGKEVDFLNDALPRQSGVYVLASDLSQEMLRKLGELPPNPTELPVRGDFVLLGLRVESSLDTVKGSITMFCDSDRGLVRRLNEDSCFAFSFKVSRRGELQEVYSMGVADGAGGLSYGEVASSEAVLEYARFAVMGFSLGVFDGEVIRRAFHWANEAILEASMEKQGRMASTLSALALRDGEFIVGHVGDSRVYLLDKSNRVLQRLTHDHRLQGAPRNILTNALGNPRVNVDIIRGSIADRNFVAVAVSDGVTDLLSDQELSGVISSARGPKSLTMELIRLSKSRGGYDNASAAVLYSL